MTEKHRENVFEDEVCAYLKAHGWLHDSPEVDRQRYDRELALYPEDVFGWLQDTQPEAWAKLAAQYSEEGKRLLLERMAQVMDAQGSLAVLRHGFKDVSAKFDMCQFRPSSGLNPDIIARYNKVRLRVVRQLHYSTLNENSIDLVLFVNGIPVATIELKTDFTQNVQDAIRQYKKDRLPKDPGTRHEEVLLTFKRRSLVHFAVSSDEIYMSTELKGKSTYFLPFNLGYNGGAGNPPNPNGYRTSYFWERILDRDVFLGIVGRYVHLEKIEKIGRDGKKFTKETIIFPRFHQWEVVIKLVATAQKEGAGQKYLIQHSAGSGKSNSIAWLAHQLAGLHDSKDKKIFDSVIVITDRTVLDSQLQDAIYQFEHKQGVVKRIDKESVKSEQLVTALVNRIPIIIVTIQTFPFVLEAVKELTSLKDRNFAVIADEAHSSQTGAAARKLKQVLTAEQIEEGEEISVDDLLAEEMAARPQPKSISYFAFTATPKAKTLELFGRKGMSGLPEAFHLYTMQQAIEEGFILDVLQNFTPYKLAFKLAHNGKDYNDETVEKSEAVKSLMRWVRLHPYNISQKVQIIVEHYRQNVMPLLNGEAKAMVVTASRKEAVRYKLTMDKYIREQRYKGLATLVAFSGEVVDTESGPNPFTENNMNTGLNGRDIRDGFDTDDYQVLIVANKYQTGFDQPKLVAMYVDKKLAGVAAVQTLSRLNRIHPPNKDRTFILDFVNDSEDIKKAFQPYYKKAELLSISDPNLIHDLQAKLDAMHIYTAQDVDLFVRAYFVGQQKDMQSSIAPAVDRYRDWRRIAKEQNNKKDIEALDIFRKDVGSFIRAYDFLSQIINYGDTDLEKRSIFFRHLLPWLQDDRAGEPLDLSAVIMTHYKLKQKDQAPIKLGDITDEDRLKPITGLGSRESRDPHMIAMAEIIQEMNDLFEGELTEADYIGFATHVSEKMMESDVLAKQAAANTREQFGASPDFRDAMIHALIECMDNHQSMAKQSLENKDKQNRLAALLADVVFSGFAKKRQSSQDLEIS